MKNYTQLSQDHTLGLTLIFLILVGLPKSWSQEFGLRTMPAVAFFPIVGKSFDASSFATYTLGGYIKSSGPLAVEASCMLFGLNYNALRPESNTSLLSIANIGMNVVWNAIQGEQRALTFHAGPGLMLEGDVETARSKVLLGFQMGFSWNLTHY